VQVRDVAIRIDAILEERHRRLPRVQAELRRWQETDELLTTLTKRWDDLRQYPSAPVEVQRLPDLPVQEIRQDVAAVIEMLRVVEARFSRGTVNIGVSGSAQVGKSTLLQAISGLGDEQLPRGSGQPETAVRSRIFHSATHQRATLRLHSYRTFAQDVLQPFHTELRLPEPPSTVADFRGWSYPEPSRGDGESHKAGALLERLREMHAALGSYEAHLTGDERVVELADLRPFVAYPTREQMITSRPYLAVRDVRIECAFPHAQVEHLGITDLPGLGEILPDADRRHLEGLRNEVDVVLLVKRPAATTAYWSDPDEKVVSLLDEARGFVSRRDFVYIVINSGGIEPRHRDALRRDILRLANHGEDGRHFTVCEADTASPEDVFAHVLLPVLTHLAERLGDMDEAVFQGTSDRARSAGDRVGALGADVEQALRAMRGPTGVGEDLEARTQRLLREVASSLSELKEELGRQARSDMEDEDYLESVERTYERARQWVEEGLGKGREAWCEQVLLDMQLKGGAAGVAEERLNRARIEIAGHYTMLDDFFTNRLRTLWREVAERLARHMGVLLQGSSGDVALNHLADLLREASDPCPTLERAVRGLLDLRLDYRTQLHPRVRFELDGLALQRADPSTGRLVTIVQLPAPTREGADDLFQQVAELAEQAVWEAKKALLLEAVMPTRVLFAATEQFVDTLVRSEDSEIEFRRLARSYRDEIWPGAYQGIDEHNAHVAAVRRTARALEETLTRSGEVTRA
jgi:hypothetical protein